MISTDVFYLHKYLMSRRFRVLGGTQYKAKKRSVLNEIAIRLLTRKKNKKTFPVK